MNSISQSPSVSSYSTPKKNIFRSLYFWRFFPYFFWKLLLDIFFPSFCDFCKKRIGVKDDLSVCQKCKDSIVPKDIPVCEKCGHPLENGGRCPHCIQSPSDLSNHVCAFFYQDLGRQLIKNYKFDKRRSYIKTIADLCAISKGDFLRQFDIIVPVTLAKSDYFERDFCPVLAVCNCLSRKLNLKLVKPIIKKPGQLAQHAKNREERKKGVAKQYQILPKIMQSLEGKKIVIIDDVCTTGATLEFFHQKIQSYSPSKIGTFSFARTILELE